MALNDTVIKAAKPREKNWKLADERGLYLLITPAGGKLWRIKFRLHGKEKKLSLGAYPDVGLAKARKLRDAAREQLAAGQDPALERKKARFTAKLSAGVTFASVAREYINSKMKGDGRAEATINKAEWFLDQLEPAIGQMPVADVDPQMLLAALKRLEAKGRHETAKKCRSFASRVFRYGVATGRCKSDPAQLLQGALITPKAKHYAAILEPAKLGELLRAIEAFSGSPVTMAALRIAPHVFVRPGELRHAEWSEFDLKHGIWNIPAGKMKARRPHAVPLSKQVREMLKEVRALTGRGKYVFPSAHGSSRPMSENTLNASFRRMGFEKDEVTAHGLRATASTMLNESGLWNPDAIERALAHGESNATRGAYHRGLHWDERVLMAQWWSDHLDELDLPDDFDSRSPAERAEILSWVRTNVFGRSTAYGRFQAEAMKHRFALSFDALPRRAGTRSRPQRLDRIAPRGLQVEMNRLVEFKTATLAKVGVQRNGVWCEETRDQRIEHFGLMFGAMTAAPDGPVAGMGLPAKDLTFGMLAFPQIWDWYLNWRLRRRGFFTTWEVDMLRLGMALCRRQTGWLSQSPDLANHLCSGGPISDDDIERARLDWQATCDQLWDYARSRVKEVARVARVHRDPFEPILPILESSSPVAAYRLITEEIDRRTPDARRYPVAAAEAVRSFLMLRLGLHLGVRQRNLRQLMLCRPGEPQRTERELETLRRGELRWIEHSGQWEVFIPSIAFKNGRSSFFGNRPFRLILPDVAGLYEHLEDYVQSHRDRLLKGRSDPGTLFVKTVKGKTKDASYEGTTFYEAWRLAVQRYGIWNPYTRRGAIAGLLPHGPHSVRDVLATHLLKQTGSYEQASYAIQDTPETVAKHYARFLPQDKAALAADILNRAWS